MNTTSFNIDFQTLGDHSNPLGADGHVRELCHIKLALDAGAQGIIVPMINTAQEAADLVRYALDRSANGVTFEALRIDLDDGGESGGAISLVKTPGTWTFEDMSGGVTGRFADMVFGNNFGTLNIAMYDYA